MTATAKAPLTDAARSLRLAAAKVGSKSRPLGGCLTNLATITMAGVDASTRAGFNTGCWRFEQGKHVIVLGEDYTKHMRNYAGRQRDKMAALFGEAILRHETWHGRATVRDLDAIAALCRSKAIPFVLVNMLEDARIEHRARTVEGEPFHWTRYAGLNVQIACPASAFMITVHRENGRAWGFGKDAAEKTATRTKVQEFYDRAITATDTYAIVELAQEWVEYWTSQGYGTNKQRVDGTNVHASDTLGSDSDGSLSQMAEQAAGPVHTTVTVANANRDKAYRPARRTDLQNFHDYTGNQQIDASLATRIANKMRDIVARSASPRSARTSTSGSRLHVPGVAVGSDQSFRSHGKTGGKPTLVVVVDFSGSMSRDWGQHGRYFVAAVLRMVRSGAINATLYATGGGTFAEIPTTLTDAQINALGPHHQGENIRGTLDQIAPIMQAAHATVIYTDAELMDGSVDAQAWRRKGVDLVGAVVIPDTRARDLADKQRGEMKRHFGCSVTASNGEALATKLAQYLGQRWAA